MPGLRLYPHNSTRKSIMVIAAYKLTRLHASVYTRHQSLLRRSQTHVYVCQTWSKGHTYTNPGPGQYLTHAHSSYITRAVAAIDNCFALIGALGSKGSLRHGSPVHRADSYSMLMSPNMGETAVHVCHCRDDIAVCMREILGQDVGWCIPTGLV